MRCCGRISCFRILHLMSPKSGNCKKKKLVLAMHFDSLPDNSRASPDVCFVTNLRLSLHTKLRLLHSLCVIPGLAETETR
jgi:hypothetical protein